MHMIKMGFKTEFNWALKLKPEQGLAEDLKVDGIYSFSKDEYRVYPVGVPIDLLNDLWEVIAKVVIVKCINHDEKTEGKYKVIKIYKGKEKEILTQYWRETVGYFTKLTDLSNTKAT